LRKHWRPLPFVLTEHRLPNSPSRQPRNAPARNTCFTEGLLYDFGDHWEHKIKVEKILPPDSCAVPMCLGGANACLPEDVGGPYSYPEFLEALADPVHPEHDDLLEWHGGPFDPTVFDLVTIKRRLASIKL
jgi:hypothetical protein